MSNAGCIYILTNPSFKEYVKIGYASDLEKGSSSLIEVKLYHTHSELMPFMRLISL